MAKTTKREEPAELFINGSLFSRARWDGPGPCPDCGVPGGSLHVQYCDIETCPRCYQQLLSCDCEDIADAS